MDSQDLDPSTGVASDDLLLLGGPAAGQSTDLADDPFLFAPLPQYWIGSEADDPFVSAPFSNYGIDIVDDPFVSAPFPNNRVGSEERGTVGELSGTDKRDKNGLLIIDKLRYREPTQWTITHQIIWLGAFGRQLPRDFSSWPRCPIGSIATPPYYDISGLTIPFTACELLTFFPRHIEIPEMQERFSRNKISSTFQANFINYQRNLTIPHIFTLQQVRNMMKKAFKTYPPINPLVSCSTYTVQHYKLTLPCGVPEKYEGEDIKIPYMLFNCADGVDGSKYPKGRDAGPFTKALRHALIHDHDLKLQDFDKYIEILGISRDLDELYSDRDFMERFLFPVKSYKCMLEAEAEKMGYSWDA